MLMIWQGGRREGGDAAPYPQHAAPAAGQSITQLLCWLLSCWLGDGTLIYLNFISRSVRRVVVWLVCQSVGRPVFRSVGLS